MKKRKRILSVLLMTMCLMMGIGTYASAAFYSATLSPPFNNCAKRTGVVKSNGSRYVSPNAYTMSTTYCIILEDYPPTTVVSSYVKTGTPGKEYFTYLPGYGGNGHKYRMLMYPSQSNFNEYYVSGDWQP